MNVKYFKTYNRLYLNGQPQGRIYISNKLIAKNKEDAYKESRKDDNRWNKNQRTGYSTHTVKVVPITKHKSQNSRTKHIWEY